MFDVWVHSVAQPWIRLNEQHNIKRRGTVFHSTSVFDWAVRTRSQGKITVMLRPRAEAVQGRGR